MQKSKVWQAFLAVSIAALTTPVFVQAEETSPMSSGSGTAATSPSSSTATPGSVQTPTGTASQATNDEAKTDADRALNQSIRQALSADATLAGSASGIQLKTEEGEVTLEGSVVNKAAKEMIGDKIEKVAGVEDVENDLKVADSSKSSTESSMGLGGSSGLSGSGSSSKPGR